MVPEKWLIHPGETRVIDIDAAPKLKISLVGGQVDVVAHDEPTVRIEVHGVTVKDLRVEVDDERIEIDHPQLRWDNFLEVFRNFGAGGPKAEISVAVPRWVDLTLGVVSAQTLVTGMEADARLNTVSGDLLVDGHVGELGANAVSGETQVRDLTGRFNANSVSGDVTVTGELSKAVVDTVSGNILVDASGSVHDIGLNTVSGDMTVRLDEGLPANYVMRTAGGKVRIDGETRAGGGLANVAESAGDLSGSFVDLRANSVSGDVSILHRPAIGAPAAEPAVTEHADRAGDSEASAHPHPHAQPSARDAEGSGPVDDAEAGSADGERTTPPADEAARWQEEA